MVRGLLSTYFPPLPRSVLTLQVGGLVNSFGNGMVIPFMFIYLHNVRGIGLGVTGLIVAAHAVVSIIAGPIFGSQIDRFGGKRMLALSLGILCVGYAGYAFVYEPWQGFVVAAVSGIGVGGFWPAQSTLITGLTPPGAAPVRVRDAARRDEPRRRARCAHGRAHRDDVLARDVRRALPPRCGDVPRLRVRDVRARSGARPAGERALAVARGRIATCSGTARSLQLRR